MIRIQEKEGIKEVNIDEIVKDFVRQFLTANWQNSCTDMESKERIIRGIEEQLLEYINLANDSSYSNCFAENKLNSSEDEDESQILLDEQNTLKNFYFLMRN
ncbi:MAG: hypothetical protein ACR2HS_00015 [Gammaproteobacteria bacterium]